ncbi:rai1 protein, partial [Dissophora ornata]
FSDNQFPLQPLDRFKVKSAPFRQPVEIGSFSYDEKRNFVMDDSQLKYYFPPDLRKPNNLSVNYDKYCTRDTFVDEHIDALLDALQKDGNPERPSTTKADFICYRGVITKIMCTPYTKNEPWELGATLYKGSIYIEEHVSSEKRKNALGSNDRHKLLSYWGYRFETICTISKPVSELRRDPELTGRLDGTVNTNFQYCTVARTKLGQNSIIMGAEVDCTSEPKDPSHNPISNYIELKTSRVITSARDEISFERHKLLKFWAQSFLPGVPTIIVGFRDDDGNVVVVETFKTMEIPRLVRGKEGAWDTTICINFLDGVFNFLRKIITTDDPEVTYTIRWAYPFQAIEVEFAGKKNAFLTERFLRHSSRPNLS